MNFETLSAPAFGGRSTVARHQGENGAGEPVGTDGPCITEPNATDVDPIWKPNGVLNTNSIMYNCLFPAMIKAWRRAFKVPDAYFGFVQLASWMQMGGGAHRDRYGNGDRGFAIGVAGTRQAQMAGATLPKVGHAMCKEGSRDAVGPRPAPASGYCAIFAQRQFTC